MPKPPRGEQQLRGLADRYGQAEGQVLALLAQAATGDRRQLLIDALTLLNTVRHLDHRAPVAAAYLHEHPKGSPDAVRDLAASLHQRLYRGATTAMDGARQAFKKVAPDNVDDLAATAVLADVDRRGIRWSLGRLATMTTATIGRQATSRGVTDAVGDGGVVHVEVGDCALCQELFSGDLIIGQDALPPGHPGCSCTVTR